MEASSSISHSHVLWNKIWNSSLLPRIKLFASRACSNALPTKVGLSVRVPSWNSMCAVCGDVEEMIVHALKECKLARVIWLTSRIERVLDRSFAVLGEWWEWVSDEIG